METIRELWRQRWLDSINELTSLDLQTESWLNKQNANPHWSYVEFISCYFDDLILDEGYEPLIEDGVVSLEEYAAIKEWHTRLRNYSEPNSEIYNHAAILNDKEWLGIVEEGRVAKQKLGQLLENSEREILLSVIDPTPHYVWP